MKDLHLVEPEDDFQSPAEHSLETLIGCGFSRADAEKLNRLLRQPCLLDLESRSEDDEVAHRFIDLLKHLLDSAPEEIKQRRDAKVVHLLQEFLGLQHRPVFTESAEDLFRPHHESYRAFATGRKEAPAWYGEFCNVMEVDWAEALRLESLQAHNDNLNFDPFLRTVVLPGLPLDQIIELEHLPETLGSWGSRDRPPPQDVYFWLNVEFKHLHLGWPESQGHEYPIGRSVTLDRLLPAFTKMQPRDLAKWLPRLINSLEKVLGVHGKGGGWRLVALSLKEYCALVAGLTDLHSEDTLVCDAWWLLSVRVYSEQFCSLTEELQANERDSLVLSATTFLGRHRAVVREKPDAFEQMRFRLANEVLFYFGKPWDAMNANLQLFASLSKPAVSRDLRTWPENGFDEQPPQPLCEIPARIADDFCNSKLKAELERDPELLDLRKRFAEFCLARLKTRKASRRSEGSAATPFDPVEPRVWWRRCYARALQELRVNPGGKSHHVLYWSSRHDPDEEVRKHAKSAYRVMRHGEGLERGQSPRRPLMAAYWWLRQAHLFHLGIEVDPTGAQRTRTKELRRIREWTNDELTQD